MKILLINPPTRHIISSEVPRAVREEGGQIPPLGLLYLHAAAQASGRHQPVLWDANLDDPDDERLRERIAAESPGAVGITTTTHALVDALRVADAAKSADPAIEVIIGGPHVSIFPEETVSHANVDWVIRGEGEESLLALLDRLEDRASDEPIPGVISAEGVIRSSGELARPAQPLDRLPFPDRTALPYRRYRNVMAAGSVVGTLITSRGCPFQCAFCSTPHEACRMRSPANVVDEIEEIIGLGVRDLDIMDDTFNLQPARVIAICDEIVRRGLDVRWNVRARVRGVTREMLEAMKKAGCARIQFGVETGTDEGMKRLNKGLTVSEALEVFRLTRQVRIQTVAYFMVGCPHERSEADVRRTIDFAIKLDPDFAMFNVFTPYPGTALYQEALERQLLDSDQWQAFAAAPRPDFRPRAWTEFLDDQQLYRLLDEAYRRFYWRPRVIVRNLRNVGGWKGLAHKARAAVKMLPGMG